MVAFAHQALLAARSKLAPLVVFFCVLLHNTTAKVEVLFGAVVQLLLLGFCNWRIFQFSRFFRTKTLYDFIFLRLRFHVVSWRFFPWRRSFSGLVVALTYCSLWPPGICCVVVFHVDLECVVCCSITWLLEIFTVDLQAILCYLQQHQPPKWPAFDTSVDRLGCYSCSEYAHVYMRCQFGVLPHCWCLEGLVVVDA